MADFQPNDTHKPPERLSPHMKHNLKPVDRILIVTVTKTEAQAVLDNFSQASDSKWTRRVIEDKTYYDLGVHGGAPVFMVQSDMMGIASPGGALLTVHQAIQDLKPQAVILCGIAFGLHPDKQQLGDILVAQQILYYEPQKIDKRQGRIPQGDRVIASVRLLDRFRSGDMDWQGAPTHFGLILSGEKLVNAPKLRDWLVKTEPKAIGGEMEGAGLYAAAHKTKTDWIVVKAICDWADGEKNDDAQPLAACNAAQFVLHVLRLGAWETPKPSPAPPSEQEADIPENAEHRPPQDFLSQAKKAHKQQAIKLDTKTSQHLIDLLCKCPSIKDEGSRKTLLGGLSADLQNIPVHSQLKVHVAKIVEACLNYPDGLVLLAEQIVFFDGENALTSKSVMDFLAAISRK